MRNQNKIKKVLLAISHAINISRTVPEYCELMNILERYGGDIVKQRIFYAKKEGTNTRKIVLKDIEKRLKDLTPTKP